MRLTLFVILFFIFSIKNISAQNIDINNSDNDSSAADTLSIDIYDRFNPMLGGDSIRWKAPGVRYTGSFEEFYSNGTLRHKGFYTSGQLITIYKNYFDNGQLERSFKIIDTRNNLMELYYKSGLLKSKKRYYKGSVLKEEDYYPDGKMEYYEENDKSFEFYIAQKYFYENGNPQTTLELSDTKNKMYQNKEYWPNGNIKEEGTMFYNKVLNDYVKNGTRTLYDNTGLKIAEEDYIKGQLNEERKF